MDELLKELQALIDKYAEGTPEGVTEEEAKQDEELSLIHISEPTRQEASRMPSSA